jgi:Uma2 family endonuclease
MLMHPSSIADLLYPDHDGQPMADNTKQFNWIVKIKENLELLYANNPDVFVAGDLLWYPLQGSLQRVAPDVMVVFGRPKGDRGSYKQWEEDNVVPQVVFEILSPGNTQAEMADKFRLYDKLGVQEYYLYSPDSNQLDGWLQHHKHLQPIFIMQNWVSPKLGIRFELFNDGMEIYFPDGRKFLSLGELEQQARQAEALLDQERQRVKQTEALLDQERQRSERLAKRLRELGINPEAD